MPTQFRRPTSLLKDAGARRDELPIANPGRPSPASSLPPLKKAFIFPICQKETPMMEMSQDGKGWNVLFESESMRTD